VVSLSAEARSAGGAGALRLLIVNGGSASWKLAVVDVRGGEARERARSRRERAADEAPELGFGAALAELGAEAAGAEAVAHRVVHGGRRFLAPVAIDAEVEAEIERLVPLAPLHNPLALAGLRAARRALPGVPQLAVFDTAFHAGREPESLHYALPRRLAEEEAIFRYGFHGIAHASLAEALAESEGREPGKVTAVTLQLGQGCSACAIRGGRSFETSMGFTPLEGLPMGTRPGNLDAGAVLQLLRRGRSVDEVERVLQRESGLRGLAGSSDVRELLRAEARGDADARLALALFVRRIVETTGGYLTLLAGEGALVFGGGIGENAAEVRARVCEGLRAWNVALDPARNASGRPGRISADGSRAVYALRTEEERWMARAAAALLTGARSTR
jgi:acetate kinase